MYLQTQLNNPLAQSANWHLIRKIVAEKFIGKETSAEIS